MQGKIPSGAFRGLAFDIFMAANSAGWNVVLLLKHGHKISERVELRG